MSLNPIDTQISFTHLAQIFSARCHESPPIPQEHYDYAAYDRKNKANLSSVPEKTQYEAVARIFREGLKETTRTFSMSIQTARDLKLLPDGENNRYLAGEIDKTATKVGKFYFYYCLTSLPTDYELITKRQRFARALSDAPQLQNELEQLFDKLQENEAHMLGFFAEFPPPVSGRFRHLRFTAGADDLNYRVNQYHAAVSVSAIYKTMELGLSAALKTVSVLALPIYAVSLTGALGDMAYRTLDSFARSTMVSSGVVNSIVHTIGNTPVRGAVAVASVALAVSSVRSNLGYFLADLHIESYVQNKLVEVAHYVRNMQMVYNLLLAHPTVISDLEHFQKLQIFFDDPVIKHLVSLLHSSTFDSKAKFLFWRGPLVLVWERFLNENVKRLFKGAFLAIGEIDTALSVAKLARSSRNFCFPAYARRAARPFIQAEGFTNPTIDTTEADRDSILLGEKHPQNLFITADNGRGKSTKLRALTYVVAMQGLGIAPAEHAKLTIFDYIFTSKGVGDSSVKSLHQAQCSFAANVIKFLDKNPSKKTLVVLDEFFTATSSLEGASLLGAFLDDLRKRKNAIVLAASHHLQLINKLEDYGQYTIAAASRKMVPGSFYKIE